MNADERRVMRVIADDHAETGTNGEMPEARDQARQRIEERWRAVGPGER